MKLRWLMWISVQFALFLQIPAHSILFKHDMTTKFTRVISQDPCEDAVRQLVSTENWAEQLVNPVLSTSEEISERFELYAKAFQCLPDDDETLPVELRFIKRWLAYFLIFIGGYQTPYNETKLILYDFAQSNDPAIIKVRDEAGIAPPKGFVFVRFYASREAMPDLVRQAFSNEETAGVTILMRYIAILAEEKSTWEQQAMQSQTLPETVSHELVHAYMNSVLGLDGFEIPKWYHEGLAIYFSGSGKGHTVITPNITIQTTPPDEYQQYDTVFRYLEAKTGREKLLEKIKQSLEQVDPSILYQDLDIPNEQVLFAHASAWKQQRLLVNSVVLLAAILVLIWLITRFIPEVRCQNCGYGGKKKEFINEFCPQCRRKYNRASLY